MKDKLSSLFSLKDKVIVITGAIGLLGDMGLISRTWSFRSVIYSVTEKGMEVLNQ